MLAAVRRAAGDTEGALAALSEATPLASAGSVEAGLVALERGASLVAADELDLAFLAYRQALDCFEPLGARRLAAAALLRMAELAARGSGGETGPAEWLARAQSALGDAATWRDRRSLRAAFRKHGRRLPDHVLSDAIAQRLDQLDRSSALLESAAFSCADDVTRVRLEAGVDASQDSAASPDRLAAAMRRMLDHVVSLNVDTRRIATEMSELAAAVAAERNQLREMLLTLADASQASSVAELSSKAVEIARGLVAADCALLLQARQDGFDVLALSPAHCQPTPDVWKPAVAACLRASASAPPSTAGAALRRQMTLLGPAFAVPLRSQAFEGAIYVDKLGRGGQFDEAAYQVVSLLATYLGQSLGMLLARDAEQHAMAEVSAAFRAIRDGVLSVDADGLVRATNAAAVRMLNQGELVGRKLGDLPALAPLFELLVPPRSTDGAVVRLKHGRVVVTARRVEIPGTSRTGVVATLVEHERARRAAMHFVNVRPRFTFDDIVGVSRPMREAVALARHAATLDANILITGESGTGKEVFAQAIHTGGERAQHPFVGLNCAALPRDLLESELFGYEHGSFTGARQEGAIGKFELAGEGTLLLDEIGDMPLDMQAKLLRVVQERVVVRIGGAAERPVRARLIATTHRHLEDAVERGAFRLDLLFRIRVLHIHLPPLRERLEDIEPLAVHFVRQVASVQGKAVDRISPALLDTFLQHDWPGNVRELANVIEREVSMLDASAPALEELHAPLSSRSAREPVFSAEPPSVARFHQGRAAAAAAIAAPVIVSMAEVERKVYLDALAACSGHVGKAASALGVSRSTFYDKLKKWGLRVEEDK